MSEKKKQIRAAFRRAVFRRDKHRCVVCGRAAVDPHHVTDRNDLPNGGYVVENGISLCGPCHELAEQYHATGTPHPGYSPEELYARIGSSYERLCGERTAGRRGEWRAMNETQWLTWEDPRQLAEEVYYWCICGGCRRKRRRYEDDRHCLGCKQVAGMAPLFSARKYRLIGCACCRFIWDDLASDGQRRAVEVAERYAEGETSADELRTAWRQAAMPGGTTASQFEHEPLLATVA